MRTRSCFYLLQPEKGDTDKTSVQMETNAEFARWTYSAYYTTLLML